MPAVVTELFDTGGRFGEEFRTYSVAGATTYVEAREALLAYAPSAVPIDSGGLLYILRDDAEVYAMGENLWFGRVQYTRFAPDGFSFEIGGGTEHIVVNDRGPTFAYAPAGKSAPPTNGLIGIDGDTIHGCDIPPGSTAVQFQRRKIFLDSQITAAFIGLLTSMRYAVNDAQFYGLASGEALLLGVRGDSLGDGSWALDFRWAGSPNRTNFGIPESGSIITGIDKEGWDYLWVLYEDDEDLTALVKKPRAAYVERLLPRMDFSALGIGTAL